MKFISGCILALSTFLGVLVVVRWCVDSGDYDMLIGMALAIVASAAAYGAASLMREDA